MIIDTRLGDLFFPISKSGEISRRVMDLYVSKLESSPLITKAVTSGCITALSNYISQRMQRRNASNRSDSCSSNDSGREGGKRSGSFQEGKIIRWNNVVKFLLFGLVWAGPSCHYWQNALEKIVPRRMRESKGSWAIRKTVVDQLAYGPVANAVFLCFMGGVVERKGIRGMIEKLQNDFLHTQINGWLVWPLASVLNQFYVPLQLRVLWLNIVSLVWSTWLMLHKSPKKKTL